MNYWKGEHVELRGLELEDAPFFYDWNKEVETQKNLDQIWFPSSLIRQEKWVEKQALKSVVDDAYFFVIVNNAGERVGMIHAKECDKKNGNFSYAIGIVAPHRKKGYASSAIQMVLRYYFQELRYHKVWVGIYEFNKASIHLHRKLGFQEEGRLREMVYGGNAYHDLFKFGMLKIEFEEHFC
ncbi:MAG: GNAT family N-acetyltransferase [Bacteroidota bacterium]